MEYQILKPKRVNLEELVKKNKPGFNFSLDKAYLIIYLVIRFSNKKNNEKTVRLSSTMLQKLIGRDYNKYIKYLRENFVGAGYILHGFKYAKNKPFGYKLSKFYYDGGFELYTITDSRLIIKYKSIFVKHVKNEQIRLNYYFLEKYFKKLTVFNPKEAVENVNQLESKKQLKNGLDIVNILNKETKMTLKQLTDGRVHSNITRLSKKSRQFLQYEDEFLAEIDISSAVPFILYLILNYYCNNNLINILKLSNNNLLVYMLDKVMGDIDKTELEQFGASILDGSLYEQYSNIILNQELYETEGKDYNKVLKYYQHSFKDKYGHYFDGDMLELKKFAKQRMLSMIFAQSHAYKFEQIAFKKLFPTILKFLNDYKNVTQCRDVVTMKIDKKDRHKKLSHLCFQFEANVMIDNIARNFDKKHKGKVPVFTLHDCLLTKSSYAVELKEFMLQQFIELFGIAPNLTVEYSKLETEYQDVS
jgi:hypothetical protein